MYVLKDLIQPEWTQDSITGQKMRVVTLTVSLSQAVGPKSSQITETQVSSLMKNYIIICRIFFTMY